MNFDPLVVSSTKNNLSSDTKKKESTVHSLSKAQRICGFIYISPTFQSRFW